MLVFTCPRCSGYSLNIEGRKALILRKLLSDMKLYVPCSLDENDILRLEKKVKELWKDDIETIGFLHNHEKAIKLSYS